MNQGIKNKLLTGLVLLLLVANAATIAVFWFGRKQGPPQPKGTPKDFLINELKLEKKQQEQLEALVKEHRQAVEQLREKVKEAKDKFFDLLKQPDVADSVKKTAATAVSKFTEQIDLLTLNHFQKLRALCSPEQQKKFDEIIHEVTSMMGAPRPPPGPGGPQGPPPGGDRPPPPGQ